MRAAVRAEVGVRERAARTPEAGVAVETPDVSRLMRGEFVPLAAVKETFETIFSFSFMYNSSEMQVFSVLTFANYA